MVLQIFFYFVSGHKLMSFVLFVGLTDSWQNSVAALLGVVYGFFIFSVAHYCLRISKPRHNASA